MALMDWIKGLCGGKSEFSFDASSLSACGLVRKENQDSLLAIPEAGFFCVADGMGGGKGGELASRWICESLTEIARQTGFPVMPGARRVPLVDEALQDTNRRIRAYANEQGFRSMGSTVAIVLFDPTDWAHPSIVHAGDSRVYRLRRGRLQLLTRDHTVGNELSRKTHSRIESDGLKSRRNPLSHILTRAVGTEFRVRSDWQKTDACVGDRFLLCTDGVHDMLSDGEIEAALRGRTKPDDVLRRLEAGIVAAGAGDNYSMVCFEVRRK